MPPKKKPPFRPVLLALSEPEDILVHREEDTPDDARRAEAIVTQGVLRASLCQLAEIKWFASDTILSPEQREKLRKAIFDEVISIAKKITPSRKEDPNYSLDVYCIRDEHFRVSMVRLPSRLC